MKKYFLFIVLLYCTSIALADGPGFNIERKHAMSIFTFTGATDLQNHILLIDHYHFYKKDTSEKLFFNQRWFMDTNPYTIETQEGGRRWEEEHRNIYLSLVDTLTGLTTDSLKYFAKDYDINFKITGVKNGKLQFTADSIKAVYQYSILNNKEEQNTYRRNRILFIACSLLGFFLLIAMFIRNKNKTSK